MKILKFGAMWCPGCLTMKPKWKEIENELPWLETEYFDVDQHLDKVRKYNLNYYPTFIFVDKKGNEIKRFMGDQPKERLVKIITELKNM